MKERILLVGLFRWNAGSSQTAIGYHHAAEAAGCEVAVCSEAGYVDDIVAEHIPTKPISWATHLVFAYEDPQFLSHDEIDRCLTIPKHRRTVIDTDAHWGPEQRFGADTTGGIFGTDRWRDLYQQLTNRVLQPRLGTLPEGATYFPYFGIPDDSVAANTHDGPDVQYIGNNWWRWEALSEFIKATARPGRSITVRGRWWDHRTCPGYRDATTSDPDLLDSLGVTVLPSVPLGEVASTMGSASVTPVLSRPKLSALKMLLPRVFETVSSGSLPHFPPTMSYLLDELPELEPFIQQGKDDTLVDRLLQRPDQYREAQVRAARAAHDRFNYPANLRTLRQLIAA